MRIWKRLFLVTCVLAVLSYVGTAALGQQLEVSKSQLLSAISVQERHTPDLMKLPDVVGTGVSANRGGKPIIKIYLKRGGGGGLPLRLGGLPVVTEVVGEIFAAKGPPGQGVDPTARFPRPVPIGVSTGHPDITAGTIGCRVTDGSDVYALSNNHVYADVNAATIGDAVIQPGTFDGGVSPADDIGTLFDFEPIDFAPNASNIMDAAIALSSTSLLGNSTPSDGYGTPRIQTAQATVGMRVMKYGRTTSQTKGRVDALNATVNVNYGAPGVARFIGQIIIRPGSFSAGGDSGSLIVVQKGSNARKPVALLFAGSDTITIASPIDAVLNRFGVTVDGQ